MRDERLRIYLNDHLALLVGELELARRCRSQNTTPPLSEFLDRLIADLKDQQSLVRDVIKRLGGTENVVKQGAAWLAEKLGRLKLNDSLVKYSELSRVLELEALAVTALERVALWETLEAVLSEDERLSGIAFGACREQSQRHLDEAISRRRFAAQQALGQ